MSATLDPALDAPRPSLLAHASRGRDLWLAIDTNERAIAFVATRTGALAVTFAVLLCLAAGLQMSLPALALVGLTVLGIVLVPARATAILLGASLFYFAVRPFRIEGWTNLVRDQAGAFPLGGALGLQLAAVAAVLALSFLFLLWQRRYAHTTAAKRPVLTLILLWFALLGIAIAAPTGGVLHATLWAVSGVSVSSLWILAYSAVDAKSKKRRPVAQRALFLRPVWGGSAAPIGKSFGYLDRFAAVDEADLAVTRLKALKLAVWALVLSGLLAVSRFVAFDVMALADLQTAILAHAAATPLPVAVSWASLVANYLLDLMIIAVWGHFIVAVVRLCGWRIPRNTVNPLASRTLAEFWNRYFFYFKELLVDFFFYPAFQRYMKSNVKLRIAFATFCAAGLGNFLYHFMRETWVFAGGVTWEALAIFQSALFYSLVLAAGLVVSQWRGRKVGPDDGFLAYHVWPRLNVVAFFCFLKIFDDISGEGSLGERFLFLFSLFGVSP